MTSEDFCNWLKGYLELANPSEILAREIEVIREHLELAQKPRILQSEEVRQSINKANRENPGTYYC